MGELMNLLLGKHDLFFLPLLYQNIKQDFIFIPLAVVTLILGFVLFVRTAKSRVPVNLPPFPVKAYPLVGHLYYLKDGVVEKINEWRQTTGDIYRIYFGSQLVVIISSARILKEAFVKRGEIFSDRSISFPGRHLEFGHLGILESSGPNWKEQRSVSISILRSLGMGKDSLAQNISEEVQIYMEALSELKGHAADVRRLTNASFCNIIGAVLTGNRFDFNDPYFIKLLDLLHAQSQLLGSTALLNSFPWLKYFPGDCFKAHEVVQIALEIIDQLSTKFLKENTLENETDTGGRNFINAYRSEMKKRHELEQFTHLSEPNLLMVVCNLFIAGTETTSSTLLWAYLFAIQYPEEQEKLHDEIQKVVGSGRLPTMQDKPHMPYTSAFIFEVQRLGSIAPLGLPHLCNQTTTVAGYTIPKGASIIPNLEALMKDEETWGDPHVFRPQRFLDIDNKLISPPEQFIPFSLGRRVCMGETLAKAEMFLFITSVFQRFRVHPENPDIIPPHKAVFGVSSSPLLFKPRFVERT